MLLKKLLVAQLVEISRLFNDRRLFITLFIFHEEILSQINPVHVQKL